MEDCADEQFSLVDGCHGASLQHRAIVGIDTCHHRLFREDVLDAQDLPEEGDTAAEMATGENSPWMEGTSLC